MAIANLYNLLNIPDYSEISIVKKSFRQLALKYHPDRNPEPESAEKFKTLLKAYEILSDNQLKLNYDRKLSTGFEHDFTVAVPQESDFAIRKREYERMRREKEALREVQSITAYENSLKVMPIKGRFVLLGLIFVTGIFTILEDWYSGGIKIGLGAILFFVSAFVIWNELYKYYWHQSLTNVRYKDRYDNKAYRLFLTVLFGGLFTIYGLIRVKKIWHMYFFGEVIYAQVFYNSRELKYKFNEADYIVELNSMPYDLKNESKVLIKISTKEPIIWEFAE